jgi:hypothetical protein
LGDVAADVNHLHVKKIYLVDFLYSYKGCGIKFIAQECKLDKWLCIGKYGNHRDYNGIQGIIANVKRSWFREKCRNFKGLKSYRKVSCRVLRNKGLYPSKSHEIPMECLSFRVVLEDSNKKSNL